MSRFPQKRQRRPLIEEHRRKYGLLPSHKRHERRLRRLERARRTGG